MKNRRVVVTGIGLLTPFGTSVEGNWNAIIEGRSCLDHLPWRKSEIPIKIGGEIKGFNPKEFIDEHRVLRNFTRPVLLGISAAELAIRDSEINFANTDSSRFGVIIGSDGAQLDSCELSPLLDQIESSSFDAKRFFTHLTSYINPLWLIKGLSNNGVYYISKRYQLHGINSNIWNSSSSGAQAIGEAFYAIRYDKADWILAGAYDCPINPLNILHLNKWSLLSKEVCRPFDANRDGMVLSEGACCLLLECYDSAKARGAKIYGELLGYNLSFEPHGFPQISPTIERMAKTMRNAILESGLDKEQIQYVLANGSGARLDDLVETHAVKHVFGNHAYRLILSSTKSMTGHFMSASGAIESAYLLLSLKNSVVPPTKNYESPDPECDLDYVPNQARKADINYGMLNNYGLGRFYTTLIMGKL